MLNYLIGQGIEIYITVTYGGYWVLHLLFVGDIVIDFREFVPYSHAVPFLLDLILLLVMSKVTTFYLFSH